MSLAIPPAALASLPPCPECAGGGEVNGLTCRSCNGSTRAGVPKPSRLLAWLAGLPGAGASAAGTAAGTALRWSASLPGVLGAAGVSYGLAAVVHGVFGQVPELAVAALAAGAFLLALDRRL